MDYLGIDAHKKENQICDLAEGGALIEQRIRTEPERFAPVEYSMADLQARDWDCAERTSRLWPLQATQRELEVSLSSWK